MNATADNIQMIFFAAIEKNSPEQRRIFLDDACAENTALRARVEELLAAHVAMGSIHERASPGEANTLDHHRELPGTLIGPYKLLEQIGEGGMGLVYMAEQQRPMRRMVALKLIKPGMDSKQVIDRFEAEKQALAMMDHQNIAKVLDAGTTNTGRPYFAMELVRGIPINEFCDQKRLTVRERLELMVQVCQAVQHAHQKGIIHRDLKPTNVLVTLHDTVAVPKVIDFGIAKALGQQLTDHTLHTGFAQLVGTPLYMSPEQAEMNQLGVDTRSDVYSLGVMLYELLTGTTPFDKETLSKAGLDEMRRIIREDEPLRPSARVSTLQAQALSTVSQCRNTDTRRISITLRGELDWIVMRSLAKDRSERYESVSALAADVQRYLADESVQACPPTVVYRFQKFARKNRVFLTTAAVVTASLLLGITLSVWQAIRATAAEAQAIANEATAKEERQNAVAAARAENKQRQQAERNYASALEAVNQMLANVNDPELNDFPRVGPLHRKLLKDAIGFYERVPDQSGLAPEVRFRTAKTWFSAALISQELLEIELAKSSVAKAMDVLNQISVERPDEDSYLVTLAEIQTAAAKIHGNGNIQESRKLHLRASEIYDDLAKKHPHDRTWIVKQAHSFVELAGGMGGDDRAQKDEYQRRAADLLDKVNANEYERMTLTWLRAFRTRRSDAAESDKLFVRAQDAFREHIASGAALDSERKEFARMLHYNSMRGDVINTITNTNTRSFYARSPVVAENQLDESIALYRKLFAQSPKTRPSPLVEVLRAQADLLRRRAAGRAGKLDDDQKTALEAKAETLHREAIALQRDMVTRHVIDSDRFKLVKMLQVESEHLLARLKKESVDKDERNVTADAFLTEAIQQCRFLATAIPNSAEYRERLSVLLNLQTQHFGDKKAQIEG